MTDQKTIDPAASTPAVASSVHAKGAQPFEVDPHLIWTTVRKCWTWALPLGLVCASLAAFAVYSVVAGYYAGSRPNGEWRYFSWHPLLMTLGMVGCAGVASVTKKMGGYTNTKVRKKPTNKTSGRCHASYFGK